jgi:hypothetical protein
MLATEACPRRNGAVNALVIVRWAIDCQAFLVNSVGASRQRDRQNAPAKPTRPNGAKSP